NGLKNDLTVLENFELSMAVMAPAGNNLKKAATKDAFLAHYDLVDYQKKIVKNLSFGQKRKTALGRLFMLKKKVWLLDEPFVGLDEISIQYTKQSMLMHCLSGGSIIITSHAPQSFDSQINTYIIEL